MENVVSAAGTIYQSNIASESTSKKFSQQNSASSKIYQPRSPSQKVTKYRPLLPKVTEQTSLYVTSTSPSSSQEIITPILPQSASNTVYSVVLQNDQNMQHLEPLMCYNSFGNVPGNIFFPATPLYTNQLNLSNVPLNIPLQNTNSLNMSSFGSVPSLSAKSCISGDVQSQSVSGDNLNVLQTANWQNITFPQNNINYPNTVTYVLNSPIQNFSNCLSNFQYSMINDSIITPNTENWGNNQSSDSQNKCTSELCDILSSDSCAESTVTLSSSSGSKSSNFSKLTQPIMPFNVKKEYTEECIDVPSFQSISQNMDSCFTAKPHTENVYCLPSHLSDANNSIHMFWKNTNDSLNIKEDMYRCNDIATSQIHAGNDCLSSNMCDTDNNIDLFLDLSKSSLNIREVSTSLDNNIRYVSLNKNGLEIKNNVANETDFCTSIKQEIIEESDTSPISGFSVFSDNIENTVFMNTFNNELVPMCIKEEIRDINENV